MHAKRVLWLIVLLVFLGGTCVWATEFKLENKDVEKGEIASIAEEGLTILRATGGFSPRISWTKFTQETLKMLAENPKARPYVEPFIEIPMEIKAKNRPKKREFRPLPAHRVELPSDKGEKMAAATMPMNLLIMSLVFLANLWAAYEVAVYRGRPVALVCGLAVVAPVLTPLLFLALPETGEEVAHAGGATAGDAEPKHRDTTHVAGGAAAAGGGLSMAKMEKSGGSLDAVTYKRGETTFNRRFFETKFAGFFRVVLGEKEKQMVIVVKTSRDDFVARRIARITANEMHLQLLNGSESSVAFGDIAQVQLKPRED